MERDTVSGSTRSSMQDENRVHVKLYCAHCGLLTTCTLKGWMRHGKSSQHKEKITAKSNKNKGSSVNIHGLLSVVRK